MADDINKAPDEGQAKVTETPSTPKDGQVGTGETAPKQSVPEKLQGKSSEDLISMYGNLERKLGEQGHELGEYKKFRQDMDLVLNAIYADPDTKSLVEKNMRKLSGVDQNSSNRDQPQVDPRVSETRSAMEAQIINGFAAKNGLDSLPAEQRPEVFKKIGDELVDMLDPTGTKTYAQVLAGINLQKLPSLLEKAYYLADKDGMIDKATAQARAKFQQNASAAIGSMSSAGGSNEERLSPEERETAKKLGVSEADYIKYKKE